jgi:ribosomal protein S6
MPSVHNRFYECVFVFDPRSTTEARLAILNRVEKVIGADNIRQKDDIGLLTTYYPLKKKSKDLQAYFVSYYINVPPSTIAAIKQEIQFDTELLRKSFFQMSATDTFYTYAETKKYLESYFANEKITHI